MTDTPLPGWEPRVDTFGFEPRTDATIEALAVPKTAGAGSFVPGYSGAIVENNVAPQVSFAPGGVGGGPSVELPVSPPPQVNFTPGAPNETMQNAEALIAEQQRIQRLKDNLSEDWESAKNIGARIATKVIDGIGALPATVGEGLISAITRNPFAGSDDLIKGITGEISQEELGRRMMKRDEEHRASIPELPRLTTSELQARGKQLDAWTTGEDPEKAYNKELARQDIQQSVDWEERPISSFIGDTLGTGAQLAGLRGMMRGPMKGPGKDMLGRPTPGGGGSLAYNQRLRRSQADERARQVQEARTAAGHQVLPPIGAKVPAGLPTSAANKFTAREQFMTSPWMQSLKHGASKSAATSVEAAGLAAINGDDPVAAAAWGFGAQAGGSSLLKLFENPFSRTTLGILGGYILLVGGFDELVGEGARVLDITEGKMGLWAKAALAGAGAAVLGAGRVSNLNSPYVRKWTGVADGIDSIMRGNTIGMVNEFTQDRTSSQPVIKPTLDAIVKHPERFTETEMNRIARAIKSGKLKVEIERMLERDAFREKVGL